MRNLGLLDREGGWNPNNPYGALNRAAFLDTPPAQDRAFSDYMERQERYLDRNGATAHIGQKVDGIVASFVVTLPGLAAAAHRQGAAAVRSYLEHQRAHGWRSNAETFPPERRDAFLAIETRLREFQDVPFLGAAEP